MRLALVLPGGVDRSGTERVVPAFLWLLERLALSHEVTAFAIAQEREPGRWPLLGATVVNLGLPPSRPGGAIPGVGLLRALERFRAAARAEGPFDAYHALFGGLPGLLAGRAARRAGVPCVLSLLGGELVGLRDIGFGGQLSLSSRLAVAWSLRLASRVTVASTPMAVLARRHGVRTDLVPLGVPGSWFAEAPPPRAPSFRLLSVGTLNPVKDHATLLRCFRRVRQEAPRATLEIVGEDVSGGAARRLAAELGLGDAVLFAGPKPAPLVREAMLRADLLVVSSRHEGGPLVVLEAAAVGLPTVGTAVGHVLELSPHAARSVPPGDDAALAREVLAVLRDPAGRAAMARRARDFARTHDADATAAAFRRLYEELRSRT